MTSERLSATEVIEARAVAERLAQEAAADRKAAAADRAAAEYERGQAEHRLRTVQATEAGISKREVALKAAGEPEFLAAQQEAADKLKRAEELMAQYDAAKHGAAQALIDINTREAARGKAA
jgi:hypothetical protein